MTLPIVKIEIENLASGITITDCVIRDYPDDFPEELKVKPKLEPHFQAIVNAQNLSEDDSICCAFSYFSDKGEFLGLDSDAEWLADTSFGDSYPLSLRVYPPKNTALVKCQLVVRKPDSSIWNYAWPSFVILVFILLISGIINLWF